MIRYPNGSEGPVLPKKNKNPNLANAANRGMGLEADINNANAYYNDKQIALITKRPTPINIVKVDYTKGARITDAYFEHQSTTDYNGIYRGRYLDFEAKSTRSKTSFPLGNISVHQIAHLKRVIKQGGIAFFIICFSILDEYFVIDASYVIDCFENSAKKSISLETIKKVGCSIRQGFTPRLSYLEAVDQLYFKESLL